MTRICMSGYRQVVISILFFTNFTLAISPLTTLNYLLLLGFVIETSVGTWLYGFYMI